MNKEGKNAEEREAGRRGMEYALQRAWLISLLRNEYITQEEFDEGCRRLDIKYHQTGRI